MKKFKIGNLVKPTKDIAEYILSHDGQDGYFPPSGKLETRQSLDHTNNTILALSTLIGSPPIGRVIQEHYQNAPEHNYKVEFDVGNGPFYTNMCPHHLVKIRSKK